MHTYTHNLSFMLLEILNIYSHFWFSWLEKVLLEARIRTKDPLLDFLYR